MATKQALATKYRPQDFNEVSGNTATIQILKNQIDTNTFTNCYLFVGASGCGKTTLARIFAKKINNQDNPDIIEIDGASNNGVDNIRNIINQAREKSVISKYKVFIIDECHQLTNSSQNSLLKILEDCPQYTIFIMATTDPQKLLPTVKSRVQQLKITKMSNQQIVDRLKYICGQENIKYDEEALFYIARLANGSMRQAITLLDMCSSLMTDGVVLSTKKVIELLGTDDIQTNADLLFNLYDSITNQDAEHRKKSVNIGIDIVEDVFNNGRDIKDFVNQFFSFVLDCRKYVAFKSYANTKLPDDPQLKKDLALYKEDALTLILSLLRNLKRNIRYDQDPLGELESLLFIRQ